MKKLLSIALFSLIGMSVTAQNNTFGIRTGVGRSTLKTDYADSDSDFLSKGKVSFHIALFYERKLTEKLALQGELGISGTGGRNIFRDEEDFSRKNTNAISLAKINLPILFKYYFNEKVNINTGVNFAYIVDVISRDRNKKGIVFLSNIFGDDIEIEDYVKKFEVNPFLGAEFHVSRKVFIDARYIFGVSNIGQNVNGQGFYTLKNSVLQIGIGFKILKKHQ